MLASKNAPRGCMSVTGGSMRRMRMQNSNSRPLGLAFFNCDFLFRFFREQRGFLDSQHPQAVTTMVIATNQSDPLQHPGKLLCRGPIHNLPEPCFRNGSGRQGRRTGRSQQTSRPTDVQIRRTRHRYGRRSLPRRAGSCGESSGPPVRRRRRGTQAAGQGLLCGFVAVDQHHGSR